MESSSIRQSYPLNDLQQQMWYGQLLFPKTPAYTLSLCLHLRGIEPDRFQEALRSVVREEPALALRVAGAAEQPLLEMRNPRELPVAYRDLRGQSQESLLRLAEERRDLILDPRHHSFDSLLVRVDREQFRWYLAFHHAFADGWSIKVLVDRVAERYEGGASGPSDERCETGTGAPGFAAHLTSQERYLASREHAEDERYWRAKLERRPAPLDFYGLSRSHEPGCRRTVRVVDGTVEAALRRLASERGPQNSSVGLANLFCALLFAYLSRLTGEGELSLGVPFSHRRSREERCSLGLFMRIGVLRVRVEEGDSFLTLLEKVAAESAEANRHLRYPLNNRANRLYEVMLNFHNLAYPSIGGNPVREEWLRSGNDTLPFTLHVRQPDPTAFRLELDLQEAMFPPGIAEEAMESLGLLLEQVAAEPEKAIAELRLTPHASPLEIAPSPLAAQAAARRDGAGTDVGEDARSAPDGATKGTLYELFARQAEKTPRAPAVVDGRRRITFAALLRRSTLIGDALVAEGCAAGSIVAVDLRRSVGSVAAILGILRAGGVWLPLDPAYPETLRSFMITDSGARFVISDGAGRRGNRSDDGASRENEPRLLLIDEGSGALLEKEHARFGVRRTPPPAGPETVSAPSGRPAFCLYTSGSTGRPKGAVGSHEGALNRIRWMWRVFPFAEEEVLLQKTSLNFIDSVWEIFGALLAGRATVIAPDRAVRDPAALAVLLRAHPIRRIILVPSLLRTLLESPRGLPSGFERISRWFVTGELFSAGLAASLAKRFPDAEIYNLFGTTETYDAACHRFAPPDLSRRYIPIGRPIDNMELFVLDSSFNRVPTGVRGELFIRGVGVAQGYLGRPSLSSRKFLHADSAPTPDETVPASRDGVRGTIPSTFASADAVGKMVGPLFRTGDAARLLPGGVVECLGRLDDLVKVSGYRVELEGIEKLLEAIEGVSESLVVVEGGEPDGGRLVAYATPRRGARLQATGLLQNLRDQLPPWMVPVVRVVKALPKTPSGKKRRTRPEYSPADGVELNRAEPPVSPEENHDRRHPGRSGRPPHRRSARRGSLESRLLAIWGETLGVEAIAPSDDFFDLGGTSLLALRLTAEIERRLDVKLPLSALFASPTVHSLLRDQITANGTREHLPVAVQRGATNRLPLFSVPPAGSTVSAFGALAHYLPEEQPLYSFQPAGIERGERPHLSIVTMARDYVAQMKLVQPAGPYLLSGRCFGGYVAYEMAQQLKEAGETVAALLIIDSPEAPLVAREQESHVGMRKLLHYYPTRIRYFLRRGRFVYTLRMKLRNELSVLVGRLLDALPFDLFESRRRRLRILRHLHTLAYHRYVARPFAGRITIFRAERYPDLTGERRKWERLAEQGVEWHTVAGEHLDLLKEPSIRELAAELTKCLDLVHLHLEKGAEK